MNQNKGLKWTIFVLIVIEIGLSGLLANENSHATNFCIVGESSCNSVQNSSYGQIFGIKLPFIAIGAFIILLALFFLNYKLFLAGISVGVLVSLTLTGIELLVLKQVCSSCMLVNSIILLIGILSWSNFYLIQKKASNL